MLVRLLVGAALGLGISTLGIMLFICKFSMSMLPNQAKTVVKWAAFVATIFGMGSMELYTSGLQQYARLVYFRTKYFILAFWEYHWSPGPGSIFSFQGTVSRIPMGKIFFGASMVAGVAIVLYMRWFEARSCQECGDNLVDVECEDCLKAKEKSRVCSGCHSIQDPLDGHVNARPVRRVGQRLLSGGLLLGGAGLVLSPDYSGRKVALLLAILGVSKGKVLQRLWHRLCLAWGSELPHRHQFLSRGEYERQARETTRAELENLRQLYQHCPDRWDLSDAGRREVAKFKDYQDYSPVPTQEDHRRRFLFIAASLLAAVVATACATPAGR
eukprot:EG_transcript_15858